MTTESSSHQMNVVSEVLPKRRESILKTPRRASEVFGFLTERPRSRLSLRRKSSAAGSVTPSVSSTPPEVPPKEDAAADAMGEDRAIPTITVQRDASPDLPNPWDTFLAEPENLPPCPHSPAPARTRSDSIASAHPHRRESRLPQDETEIPLEYANGERKVKVLLTNPTTVIVTAPTPSNNPLHNMPPTRIPRGPRSQHRTARRSSRGSLRDQEISRPKLLDRSNSRQSSGSNSNSAYITGIPKATDFFTPVPSRRAKSRRGSESSELSVSASKRIRTEDCSKENSGSLASALGLQPKMDLPITPMRKGSRISKSLYRTAVDPALFLPPEEAPSPASSTELSPVAKQMMFDLRSKRSSRSRSDRENRRSVAH
jgi:hypothetical protein